MKIDEIYYYDYIILYTKIHYSSNIYTFTYTCPEKKLTKFFKIQMKQTNRKRIPKKTYAQHLLKTILHFKTYRN